MAIFEGKRSSNDIMTNNTMSDDEVVASDVPPRYLFDTERASANSVSLFIFLFHFTITWPYTRQPMSRAVRQGQ